jgi:hypothetical protein
MLAVDSGRPPYCPGTLFKGEMGSDRLSPDFVFDQWLTHHLGRLYDPVTSEPLPTDLLRLLEKKLG